MKSAMYFEETQALMQTFSQEDQAYFQDLWDYFNFAGFLYEEKALREQVYNLALDFSQASGDGLTAKDYFGLDPRGLADQIIENMPNGKDYVLFYLKLLVESVDHEGGLRFNETIPYNEQMLSTITNTNVDTVSKAMELFRSLGMVEVLDDQTIYMNEVSKLLGSETYWAEKKREQREKKKLPQTEVPRIGQCPTEVQDVQVMSKVEIEKEIDIEIEKDSSAKSTTTKRKRFEKPTLSQITQYCLERNNNVNAEQFYDYYESNGWKVGKNSMKDWKAAVRTWERSEYRKPNSKKNSKEDAINVVKELMEEYANEQFEDNNGAIDVTDSVVY